MEAVVVIIEVEVEDMVQMEAMDQLLMMVVEAVEDMVAVVVMEQIKAVEVEEDMYVGTFGYA